MTNNLQSHIPSKQNSLAKKQPVQVEPARILYHLSRSPLLVRYLRGVIINETLAEWQKSPECQSIICKIDPNILHKNLQSILLHSYKQAEFSRFIQSRFLANKSLLDRVLFSIIQVESLHLAQELYFRIKDQKQSFARLASKYSSSPTAKRGGTMGPMRFCQLSFPIQYHLNGLQPKQLSQIFQLDDHYIFLRLDRSLAVQFNPQIEQQLLDELFDEWLQQKIIDRVGKASLINSLPVIEFPQRVSSETEQLSTSADLDPDNVPIMTIAPTSSFFFPDVSPTGEILSLNVGESYQVNSSFFLPSELSIDSSRYRSSDNQLWTNVIVFVVFFCLFLIGGIVGIKFFSQPTIRSKSSLGEIHKLPVSRGDLASSQESISVIVINKFDRFAQIPCI